MSPDILSQVLDEYFAVFRIHFCGSYSFPVGNKRELSIKKSEGLKITDELPSKLETYYVNDVKLLWLFPHTLAPLKSKKQPGNK